MPDSAGRNRWREEVVHELWPVWGCPPPPAIHSYALQTDEQAVAHLHFASGDVDLRRTIWRSSPPSKRSSKMVSR